VGVLLVVWVAGWLLGLERAGWVTAIVLLLVASTPLGSGPVIRAAEQWAERGAWSDAPLADAIVVLSTSRLLAPGKAAVSEWIDANRFFGGIELMKAEKAPLLVFTGGGLPWEPTPLSEGEILSAFARDMGVPTERIALTGPVTHTAEEAPAVAALLGERGPGTSRGDRALHVLLVTAAFHLPRARILFERAGLTVTPFPVSFLRMSKVRLSVIDFLPALSTLAETELALRELCGRAFFFLR